MEQIFNEGNQSMTELKIASREAYASFADTAARDNGTNESLLQEIVTFVLNALETPGPQEF